MAKECDIKDKKLSSVVNTIRDESIVDSVGFYDVHKFAKMKKKDIVPIEQFIIEGKSSRTHFLGWGIRAEASCRFLDRF